jgi:hypothetical protein
MHLLPSIGAIFTPLTADVFSRHKEIHGDLCAVKINGVFQCFCVRVNSEHAYIHPTLFEGLDEKLHGAPVCLRRDEHLVMMHPRERHAVKTYYESKIASAPLAEMKPVSSELFIRFILRLYEQQKRFCDNYSDNKCSRGRIYLDPREGILVGRRITSMVVLCPKCLEAEQTNPDPNHPPEIALDGRLIPFQGPIQLWNFPLPTT